MGRSHDHREFSPVGLIPFGDKLTMSIEAFADANGLACDSYYHDLPMWIVHERELTERTRRMQITAYLVNAEPYLSLVPSVHVFAGGGKVLVPKVVDCERVAVGEMLNGAHNFDAGKLLARLEETWNKTATLTYPREQLMEVRLPEVVGATRVAKEQ